jgi:prepilin-type N-terminal cleavage/methylation domain-containing protein
MVLKKQLKKNRKKGFTLVEVIVVLVILAILAAIAIPALTGYIRDAQSKALLSQTRTVEVAVQKTVTEMSVTGEADPATKITSAEIQRLTGYKPNAVGSIVVDPNYVVTQLIVQDRPGDTTYGLYKDGKYSTTTSGIDVGNTAK